nr:UDP-N-acetylmuramoyl-tripeptide--D-alanyl-D-alanine ligase [Deltaproteobacteria bacterium]
MKPVTLAWIADAAHGTLRQGNPSMLCEGISTDSRSIRPGEVFWALPGDRFDGHDFILPAIERAAAAIVFESGRVLPPVPADTGLIEVENSLWALGSCAGRYRHLYDIPVIAVTGSNGKTTTKEMIAAILSVRRAVLRNEGNLNNLIGLPLSLIRLMPNHEAGVFELGMNRLGEIRRLTEIADPSVGLITNIGPVHLEYLETIDGVALAKGELFQTMSPDATAIVNLDDPRIERLARSFVGKKVTFGIEHPGEVSGRSIISRGTAGLSFDLIIRQEVFPVMLPVVGEHNVMNALAAAAAVTALGEPPASIVAGLAGFRNAPLRQELITMDDHITIINDSYNANPVSMEAGLAAFSQVRGEGPGFVVVGDMRELGKATADLHYELGTRIAASAPDGLFILGEYAADVAAGAISAGMNPEAIVVAANHKDIEEQISSRIEAHSVILVKGSRKMEMERVVKGIVNRFSGFNRCNSSSG